MDAKLERFAAAFDCQVGHCRMKCNCGKEYYNSNGGWDFTSAELEYLNVHGIDLDWSVSELDFEGCYYVSDCTCWHARAKQIMSFLDGHRAAITKYLNGEKEHLKNLAESMEEVE